MSVTQSQEIVATGGCPSSQHTIALMGEVARISDMMLSGTIGFIELLTQISDVETIAKGTGVAKSVIWRLSMNDILVMYHGVRIENYPFSEIHPLGVDDNGMERIRCLPFL